MNPRPVSAVKVHTAHLPGRGTTLVHEVSGPRRAPPLVLLHGLTLTAELNWGDSFAALGRWFRVVGADQRGHGRGIRPGVPFSLEDCADDAAALVELAGLGPVTAVGYSLGGLVAQLLWRRHPHLVSGLVLCATAERVGWPPLAPLLPAWWCSSFLLRPEILGASLIGPIDDPTTRRWATAEMRRAEPAAVFSGARAATRFSSEEWIRDVDVATAVVVTTLDGVVPPRRQRDLAAAIPHAAVYQVEGTHGAAITQPHQFASVLVDACLSVASPPLGTRAVLDVAT